MSDGASASFPAMSIEQAHALLAQPGSPLEVGEEVVHGVKTKVWKLAPPTLRDVFNLAAAFGARDYLVYDNDRATISAFRAAAIKFANQLLSDGVKKGDRIALIMRNLPEWPVAFMGAVLAGAIITPLKL